jgi:flagellar motor switch protein FliM
MSASEATNVNRSLTQAEIDAMLSSVASGEVPAASGLKEPGNIRTYDFRRPDKFSHENLKSLQTIHESFLKLVSLSLSAYLRLTIQWLLISVEQALQADHFATFTQPTVLLVVELPPLDGQMIVEVSYPLATALVDRLLGGEGTPLDRPRDLTEIEVQLLRSVGTVILKSFREAWTGLVDVKPEIAMVSTSVSNILETVYNEPVVVIGFEVRAPKVTGTVSLSLPYSMLEPLLPKLTRQAVFSRHLRASEDSNHENGNAAMLEPVSLELAAVLGTAQATLRELLNLREGDVIVLDRYVGQGILVTVDGNPKFIARPGRQGRRLVAQIIDRHEGGEPVD